MKNNENRWIDFLNMPKDPVDSCPKDCEYLSRLSGFKYCNYLEVAGTPRGCKPGKGCTKYYIRPVRREK